jgi:hypothetical protein
MAVHKAGLLVTSSALLARERPFRHVADADRSKRRRSMRDDFLSDGWARDHRKVGRDFHKLVKHVGRAWGRLNAIQYDAPWRRQTARR